MALSYVKNTWVDDDLSKPVSAARLTTMENGIFDAHQRPRGAISATTIPAIASATATEFGTTASFTTLTVTEEYDSESWHPGSGMNPFNVRIGLAGVYLITGHIVWASNTSGFRTLAIAKTGTVIEQATVPVNSFAGVIRQQVHAVGLWAVADRLGMIATQDQGTTNTPTLIRLTWTLVSYV